MNKKVMSLTVIGLLGVSLLSVGLVKTNVFASEVDNKVKMNVSKEQKNNSNLTSAKTKLTKDDAIQLALNRYKDGKVQKVQLDHENNNIVYEVDVVANGIEHEIDIDANNGNILKDKVDDYDSTELSEEVEDSIEQANLKQLAKITVDQAKTIVTNKYKDGVITEVDLDDEHGKVVYEVEVNAKDGVHDIKIDAVNGNILIDEIDD